MVGSACSFESVRYSVAGRRLPLAVLDASVAAMPQLEVGELAAGPAVGGVGKELGDPHALGVGDV